MPGNDSASPLPEGSEGLAYPRLAPRQELIEANHSFPGEYIVKAFGPAPGSFTQELVGSCAARLGAERLTWSERTTRSGHRVCVTLTLRAESVGEVLQLYRCLESVPELLLLL